VVADINTTSLSNGRNEEHVHEDEEQNDDSSMPGNNLPILGPPSEATGHNAAEGQPLLYSAMPGPPLYRAMLSALLPGTRRWSCSKFTPGYRPGF